MASCFPKSAASIDGLTPVIDKIQGIKALYVRPSATDHAYVVVAFDSAGNVSGL